MATKSFYEDMVIDTEEAANNLELAFQDADEGRNRISPAQTGRMITDLDEVCKVMKW